MAWSQVIGQYRVKDLLLHALRSGRLPHALLFVGPEGVGKDAAALELARTIHCERGGEEACGQCNACRRVALLEHPDVRLVVPLPRGRDESDDDGPLEKLPEADIRAVQEEMRRKGADPYYRVVVPRANVIKVNSIREVRREASMTTSDHRRRVTIISQAEQMQPPAQNMLLKTLEEPAGDTMLILTTAHHDQLLPTIASRCQTVRFDQLSEGELARALVERNGVAPEAAAVTARLADGSYTRAVELLAEDLPALRRDVVQFVRHALSPGAGPLLDDIDRLADSRDRELIRRFLLLMMVWFRDAMVLANGGAVINLDQQEDLRRFVARFGTADLPRILNGAERALTLLDRNVQIRLLLINIALLTRAAVFGDAYQGHPGALAAGALASPGPGPEGS
ncbi:MAG TPA: DNA polymerase III subunit delta' [Bacteroidota bacterium]